jgi:UDPglucose 6-dehydrogenase
MRISLIGTGYVGLTTAVTFAALRHEVTCVDIDEKRIADLNRGCLPFYEPHMQEMFESVRSLLRFTTSYETAVPCADVVFITVGTPAQPDGHPDLSFIQSAAQEIGRNLRRDFTVVVNKSTVPIGSGNWVGSLLEESSVENSGTSFTPRFAVASNPEFLREGSALHDSFYPDRVVLGSDTPRALEALHDLYRPILEQTFTPPSFLPRPENLGAVPLLTTNLASAELVKYAANAFLALKISYINEIAAIAERVGADVTQIAKGIGLDSRIGSRFLQAGIGWGGSCFGKDTRALLALGREYSLDLPIVTAARDVNYRQREKVLERLQSALKILKGRTVGILGLAFKAETDDLRDSPGLDIARRLAERGVKVKVHDPVALRAAERLHGDCGLVFCGDAAAVAFHADALVLATDWADYRDLPWEEIAGAMRHRIILDGRNFLEQRRLETAGFQYCAIGK